MRHCQSLCGARRAISAGQQEEGLQIPGDKVTLLTAQAQQKSRRSMASDRMTDQHLVGCAPVLKRRRRGSTRRVLRATKSAPSMPMQALATTMMGRSHSHM